MMDNSEIKLHEFDMIIINSSAGKDSLCAIYEVCRLADLEGYSHKKIIISHQCLGNSEWSGTRQLAKRQAKIFGLKFHWIKRTNKNGYAETLLEYAQYRRKWPSNMQRWCTSKFKIGPGAKIVTKLTKSLKNIKVLYVFGFRKQESPSRQKKQSFCLNESLTTKSRKVFDWLPIHDWSTQKVWDTIKENRLPFHYAYSLGMPRLSCVFCIFSPFDALVIAGKYNRKLLDEYVEVEKKIQHKFKANHSLQDVQQAIENGYQPKKVTDWIM